MSRSRRKSPYVGGGSEKWDKRIYNRRFRHAVRQQLRSNPDKPLPLLREISNVYWMNKDGKQEIDPDSKWMRK